jgi:hypothetical protein
MPLLIDEFELTLADDAPGDDAVGDAGSGLAPGGRSAPGATLTPLDGEEGALAATLDLIRERRARLLVD